MASSALTMDDMASVGLGEINMDEITGMDTGADVDVVRGEEGQEIDLSDLAKSSESAPIIKVSNLILIEALKAGASDIHVEPYEKEFRVRFRDRRHPPQHHGAADAHPGPADLAPQDHGQARHLRKAASPGRPHQDPPARRGTLAGPGPARLLGADPVRRKGRHAAARQVEAAARHDAARLRPGAPAALQGRDRPAVRHRARHRADRLRQDEHPLLRDRGARTTRPSTS